MYKKSIRHGDLGLFIINELPKGLKASDSKVLLKGSHNNEHYVDELGTFYPCEKDNFVIGYLRAKKGCKLFHVEHGKEVSKNKPKEVILQAGIYELRRQHEIRHSSMEAVAD